MNNKQGSKVILKGYVIVPSEDLDAVQKALPAHIEKTREEAGCFGV
jgi:(4S)-4-hydroxy-5-phosphonooxypentane-2,3-dione isomerase